MVRWRNRLNSTSEEEPVDGEHHHRSQDRYREAPEVEPEVQHLRPRREPVEEAPHEGASHPEKHRNYAPAGITSRHQQPRDYPRDQTEDHPAEYAHRQTPPVRGRAPRV